MKLNDFFTYEEYRDLFQQNGCNKRDAEILAKRQVLEMHGSEENYRKDLKKFKAERKTKANNDKVLKQFETEFNRVKEYITDDEAKKIYRQTFAISIAQDKNRNIADRKARKALAEWESKGNKRNDYTTEDIISQVIRDNPDLELDFDDMVYDELAYMIDAGYSLHNAVNTIIESFDNTAMDNEKEFNGLSSKDKIFLGEMTQEDKDFYNQMKHIQPSANWTPEKVYRYMHDEREVIDLLEGLGLDDAEEETEKPDTPNKPEKKAEKKDYYFNELEEIDLEEQEEEPEDDYYDEE